MAANRAVSDDNSLHTPTPPIAILGAGPSGLAFARLLHLNNIAYIIFERDDSPAAVGQGGTLDIHAETGQQALKQAGLLPQFKAKARYDAQRMIVADKSGKLAIDLDGREGEDRPEIDRRDLRRILLDSVPPETIQWSSKVNSVSRDDEDKMSVELEDGRTFSGFSLVVGADGTWSKARSLVSGCRFHSKHLIMLTRSS
jgi:2-polyprenyl-6-methoxyphenol hydroxylase-like FAD-dependent oxidoreductase